MKIFQKETLTHRDIFVKLSIIVLELGLHWARKGAVTLCTSTCDVVPRPFHIYTYSVVDEEREDPTPTAL